MARSSSQPYRPEHRARGRALDLVDAEHVRELVDFVPGQPLLVLVLESVDALEMEVEEHVGAARHERSAGRVGQRNGYRERSWDTRVGTVELKVPRLRDGGYFPSLLEPRRRAERALAAVVQEAY